MTMIRGSVSPPHAFRAYLLLFSSACCCPLLTLGFVLPTPAFPTTRRSHSCSPRCGSWPQAIAVGGRPAAAALYPRLPSLTTTVVAASGEQSDGSSSGLGLDVDAESLARAREAAKNDDYEWFMEFIEGDSGVDGSTSGGVGDREKRSKGTSRVSKSAVDDAATYDEVNNGRRRSDFVGGDDDRNNGDGGNRYRQRQAASDGAGTSRRLDAGRRRQLPLGNDDYDVVEGREQESYSSRPRGSSRRSGAPSASGEFRGSNGRGGGERPTVAADEAYDYDLDDEFEGEPGRGGWEYDTGLAAGVGARRRDVDVGKVRARARVAARRLPLEDEEREAEEEKASGGGEGVAVKAIGADKAMILTGDLGYTEQEVACMDRDMADLAIERAIRRPAAGMPPDWAAAGASPPAKSWPLQDNDSGDSPASSYSGANGALNLDEILYGNEPARDGGGGREEEEEEKEARGTRRDRPRTRTPASRGDAYWREDDDEELYASRGRARRQGRDESPYFEEEDERGYGGRGVGGRREGPGGFRDDDDFEPRRANGEGRRQREGGVRRRRSRGPPKRKLNAAEKYELKMRGGDDDDEEGKIWTGVGPNGPWPTLEEFTKLLREETDVRLSLVGPWAADVVALENKFRLEAYKKWLDVLDKGIGETLEEAGLFDAAFGDQDDDYDDGGYDDERGRGGYDPRGRGDERGFRSDDRRREEEEEEGGGDRARRRERSGRRREEDGGSDTQRKFDVGSFLRSGVESLTAPAPGMEEAAARYERDYPGRKSTDSRKTDGAADTKARQRRRAAGAGDGYDAGKGGGDAPEYRRSGRRYAPEEEDEDYYG